MRLRSALAGLIFGPVFAHLVGWLATGRWDSAQWAADQRHTVIALAAVAGVLIALLHDFLTHEGIG